ncbi:MAG: hypothetical protein ACOZNI_01615 [Myxococcota bacterium]
MLRSLLFLPLLGCTAARATYFIYDAERKFNEAVEAGAPTRAVYEITLAEQFLQKAKEEDGYSDFGATEALCRKSMEYSAAAFAKANDEGKDLREKVEGVENFVPEVKPEEEKPPEDEPELDIDLDEL